MRLAHREAGTGTPLVLLHAFPLSSEMFAGQLGSLPARVIAPDLPGFGESPGVTTSMEEAAGAVLDLLDQLGVARAAFGGVSMGGYVAMALLELAPERVAGLLLMDTHPHADDAAARAKREALAQRVLAEGTRALGPGMLDRLLPAGSRHRARVQAWIDAARPDGVAGALRAMAGRPDRAGVLARWQGPSLVLVGERDPLISLDAAKELAGLLRSDLFVVPGAGHLACFEEPAIADPAIGRFMAECDWDALA
ncbi:MAG: alpha/beta fold hydrolase [Myxococcota bacterium]